MSAPLDIRNLTVDYAVDGAAAQVLRGVSLKAEAGQVVGIVGESGCGKSTLALAMMGLLPRNARLRGGEVRLEGTDLLSMSPAQQRQRRGQGIGMIFQDPMTAFNPVLTLGRQLVDFQSGLNLPAAERQSRAEAMLARVGLSDPKSILRRFVHELSGGMRQRVGIAAALLNHPSVLVADEPTTALDVTMEAQILHLLRELRREHQGAIVIITHHLGVIGELCDRVNVMYAGQIVEEASVDALYHTACHPYTRALIACDPAHLEGQVRMLPTIPGRLPDLRNPPKGCAFADRCPLVQPRCRDEAPPRLNVAPDHSVLCHRAAE
jgi:oligopeptide/dipeptide ABC transporter ATP-binding protein